MRRRWARAVVRARWAIVAGWLLAAVLTTLLLPSIRQAQVGALGDLVPNDAPAIDAEQRAFDLFGFPLLSRTIVVQRDPTGLSAAEQARAVRRAVLLNLDRIEPVDGIAGAVTITNALGEPPFSREHSTTALTYLFFPPEIGQVGRTGLAHLLVRLRIPEHGDEFVGVTGAIPARAAQADVISEALPKVEVATVALVALAMALFFRAPGPPLLTLLTVGVAYLVSIRVIAVIGQAIGVSVPSEVQPVIVVLLFGVGTDYSIFFVSRLRRRLAEGVDRRVAVERATAELVPIVSAAGLAVVLGAAALVVAQLGFLQAFGPGLAMAVLVALAVALTFVPALLAIVGERVFWPRRPPQRVPATATETDAPETPGEHRRRRGLLGLAVAHPVLTVIACLAVLLGAASGLRRLHPADPLIRGLPPSAEARQAYHQAARGFAPGVLAPTVVLVEAPGITTLRCPSSRLQRMLARQPGVAQVIGPADQPTQLTLGGVLSRTGDAARYLVVLDSDPLGSRAIRRLHRIRARLPGFLEKAGLSTAKASLAGDTALAAQTVDATAGDTARVVPAVLIVLFAVLALFLRALVAPLYLLAASVLAVAAALGLMVYVVQDAMYGEITFFVPFAAAVLLVSLGSDYTIFLAGRIWDEARRRPLPDAIVVGGSRAATSIAVAGGVLAGSFALLAIVPLRPFRELAFTMAVGLLLDVFVVRTLLVPACIRLVGSRSAWPGSGWRRRPARRDRRSAAAPEPPEPGPRDVLRARGQLADLEHVDDPARADGVHDEDDQPVGEVGDGAAERHPARRGGGEDAGGGDDREDAERRERDRGGAQDPAGGGDREPGEQDRHDGHGDAQPEGDRDRDLR